MLPSLSPRANFVHRFVIDLSQARKRLRPAQMEPPRVTRLLAQAERFQRRLETGEVRNRSDLANLEGLTRARVTQILNLLKLHPDILAFVRAMPTTAPRNWVTEKKLRVLTALSHEEQVRKAATLVPAFSRTLLVG